MVEPRPTTVKPLARYDRRVIRSLCALALTSMSLAFAQQPGAAAAAPPAAAIASMLDLVSPAERRAAADALAARSDVTLAQWLAAIQAVPRRSDGIETLDERTMRLRVTGWVNGTRRDLEILVRLPAEHATKPGPWPLLLVGHETAADGASALRDWAPLADRFGCLLAAPTEPYEPYRQEGWAYLPDARQAVLEALRAVQRRFDVDEDRIVLAGIGRGALMTWDIALRNPDRFAALVPANGSPRLGNVPFENNLRYLEALAPVTIRALQWPSIDPGMAANTRRAFAVLAKLGARDAGLDPVEGLAVALAPDAAAWDRVFAARRAAGATLVRLPDLDEAPRPRDFGRCHWLEVVEVDPKATIPWPMRVDARRWNQVDADGKRAAQDDWLRDHAARLQVARRAPGVFTATDRGIVKFRLLLTPELVDQQGQVTVQWAGKTYAKPARPSAAVLLRDFAERVDRRYLPTIAIAVP